MYLAENRLFCIWECIVAVELVLIGKAYIYKERVGGMWFLGDLGDFENLLFLVDSYRAFLGSCSL